MDNKELYKKLETNLQNIYVEIHAVYEPDGEGIFGDCYCAAVDLFSSAFTFRIYFKGLEDGSIQIENVERWHFG